MNNKTAAAGVAVLGIGAMVASFAYLFRNQKERSITCRTLSSEQEPISKGSCSSKSSPPSTDMTSSETVSSSSSSAYIPLQGPIGQPHPFSGVSGFKGCIYMDYNATTPVLVEAFHAMSPFLTTCFGNPSSSHVFSAPCRAAIELARQRVGSLINSPNPSKDIIFTSCGTESDNRAVDIALNHFETARKKENNSGGRDDDPAAALLLLPLPHVISCEIEHPAILSYLKFLANDKKSIRLTLVPVSTVGCVSVEDIRSALTVDTALVTIMHSNNEVGTIQPIRAIANAIKQFNNQQNSSNSSSKKKSHVLFHSDGAQSLGKVTLDVRELGVDMLTLVGHKFGAPKGVAALYINVKSVRVESGALLVGGGQEHGLRGGTESVPMLVALGTAADIAQRDADALLLHMLRLKLRLIVALQSAFSDSNITNTSTPSLIFNGPPRCNTPKDLAADIKMMEVMYSTATRNSSSSSSSNSTTSNHNNSSKNNSITSNNCSPLKGMQFDQLPNTVSVSFAGIEAHEIVSALADKVACSTGSACHSVPTDSSATAGTAGTAAAATKTTVVSSVLRAMQVPATHAAGTLRLSIGRHTTSEDIDAAVEHIHREIKKKWAILG